MVPAFVLFCLSLSGLVGAFGVETDEMKSVSVTEGDSVTLQTDAEIKKDDLILWRFGAEDSPLAEVNRSAQIISASESTKGFEDRLHLDPRTGSLTVRNIRTDHSGIFKAQIIRNKMIRKVFNVSVYARLSYPVIRRDCFSSSSSSSCSLLCSVVNVEYQDKNTYSCVINNPIRNQTTHLNITEVCQIHSDSECVCCCDATKAVIQLVISALVGVAIVVVLGFEITSRKAEQKRRTPVLR
ncbi:SLAM family member 5-like isoform X3 [Puntigrus tetrazona]|uniref:SLAM family member 5-like isoform X3 n=1 Tax=Puntigrus tetrazona TaxID=1606681 RepID=UPI001C8A5505|nr:SLAM family member 5-like isoform X3 [Puntigrus tetrazona]